MSDAIFAPHNAPLKRGWRTCVSRCARSSESDLAKFVGGAPAAEVKTKTASSAGKNPRLMFALKNRTFLGFLMAAAQPAAAASAIAERAGGDEARLFCACSFGFTNLCSRHD